MSFAENRVAALRAIVAGLLSGFAGFAHAHAPGAETIWWSRWSFTPGIVIVTVLVLWLYARGAFLSYKETVFYPAYGSLARIGLDPVTDERLGGLVQ